MLAVTSPRISPLSIPFDDRLSLQLSRHHQKFPVSFSNFKSRILSVKLPEPPTTPTHFLHLLWWVECGSAYCSLAVPVHSAGQGKPFHAPALAGPLIAGGTCEEGAPAYSACHVLRFRHAAALGCVPSTDGPAPDLVAAGIALVCWVRGVPT